MLSTYWYVRCSADHIFLQLTILGSIQRPVQPEDWNTTDLGYQLHPPPNSDNQDVENAVHAMSSLHPTPHSPQHVATPTTPSTPSLPAAIDASTTNVAMDLELKLDPPQPTANPQVYDHAMELRHVNPPADDVPSTAAIPAYQQLAIWNTPPESPHAPFAPLSDMEYPQDRLVYLAEQQPIALPSPVHSTSSDSGSEYEDPDGSPERRMGNEEAGIAGMESVFKRSRFVLTLRRCRSTKCWYHHHRYALWCALLSKELIFHHCRLR